MSFTSTDIQKWWWHLEELGSVNQTIKGHHQYLASAAQDCSIFSFQVSGLAKIRIDHVYWLSPQAGARLSVLNLFLQVEGS